MEERAGLLLRSKGKTLALAESCTGGLIASMLTDVPGSSDYFLASLVTYSNGSKVELLGVSPDTLQEWGAVSDRTALEMAAGAREKVSASLGLAVTGIAGPGGGSAEKPVGLVYFALDDGLVRRTERIVFSGNRAEVKRAASEHALSMLCAYLE